jgi:adenine phosphoribosyltransferase
MGLTRESMWENNKHPGMGAMSFSDDFKQYCCEVPDFPKEGISFKDITTLLSNGPVFKDVVDKIALEFKGKVDVVCSMEARGFIFGAPIAYALGIGFIPMRKPGKLPRDVYKEEYELEYGTDSIEMHQDALKAGDRVLLVDDLIAIGGTAAAAVEVVKQAGGDVVAAAFLIELCDLKGRDRLDRVPVYSLISW